MLVFEWTWAKQTDKVIKRLYRVNNAKFEYFQHIRHSYLLLVSVNSYFVKIVLGKLYSNQFCAVPSYFCGCFILPTILLQKSCRSNFQFVTPHYLRFFSTNMWTRGPGDQKLTLHAFESFPTSNVIHFHFSGH